MGLAPGADLTICDELHSGPSNPWEGRHPRICEQGGSGLQTATGDEPDYHHYHHDHQNNMN